MEDFRGRYNRPYKEYRALLPEVLEQLGLPTDTKAVWSQKAGCRCGCSPGFILQFPSKGKLVDVYVDYVVVTNPEEGFADQGNQ